MDKRAAIVEKAISLLGCGYIYGATGWICTQKRIDQQAKQYPLQAENIRKYGIKWLGKACYDCAQLVRAACLAAGISLPSGSTSQWRSDNFSEKGLIDEQHFNEPGLLFFRMKAGTTNTTEHVGINVGDGTVIEARGHASGVVRRNIFDGTWTHYARLRGLEIEETPSAEGYTAENAVEDIRKILQKLEA